MEDHQKNISHLFRTGNYGIAIPLFEVSHRSQCILASFQGSVSVALQEIVLKSGYDFTNFEEFNCKSTIFLKDSHESRTPDNIIFSERLSP